MRLWFTETHREAWKRRDNGRHYLITAPAYTRLLRSCYYDDYWPVAEPFLLKDWYEFNQSWTCKRHFNLITLPRGRSHLLIYTGCLYKINLKEDLFLYSRCSKIFHSIEHVSCFQKVLGSNAAVGTKALLSCLQCYNDSGAHPASYSIKYQGLFP